MKSSASVLLATLLIAAGPQALAQETTRVSVTAAGAQVLNGIAEAPSLSATGRFVAFYTSGPGLVPDDTNNIDDVFVRDRALGTIERISVSTAGVAGNGDSDFPSISADGRYVAFRSAAFNFDPADVDNTQDIYVRDRLLGTTTLVSKDSAGLAPPFGASSYPSISADGHFVAFESLSKDLVPSDTNGVSDIFVHELLTGLTHRVSLMNVTPPPPDKNQATGPSFYASISGNGRFVAFGSDAGNLVSGDTNGEADIFVRDRLMGSTARVNFGPAGVQGDSDSTYPTISDDGAFVVFQSKATNLVAGDSNSQTDVFVATVATGVVERVSVSTTGVQSNNFSNYADISGDGRFVAFESAGNGLVAGDTNLGIDVFLHDRQTHVTTRSTVSTSGAQGDKGGQGAAVSDDGLVVAFQSESTNLVPGDTNDRSDIFVRDALGCNGAGGWISYGAGLAGAGGFVPTLLGTGCPVPGATITLSFEHVVGGASGTLFVGLAPAAVPFKGGSLLVAPIVLQAAIGVGGAPGLAGAGSLTFPTTLPPDPGLSGVSIYLQAGFADPAAVKGVSLTAGLELEIG